MPDFIKLKPGVREKLGAVFTDWWRSGLLQKGDGPTGWWREVKRFYRNEQPETPGKNIVPFHVPLSQPRQDALTAQVCTVVGKQEPIMLCDLQDQDLADRRQRLAHKVLMNAGIRAQMSKASTDATNINKYFLKIEPFKGSDLLDTAVMNPEGNVSGSQRAPGATQCPGVEISVIKGEDMSVFPAVMGGCQASAFCGNRFWMTIAECKRKMNADEWYAGVQEPQEGDPGAYDDTGGKARSGATLYSMAAENDGKAAELYDAIVECDLSEFHPDAPAGFRRYHIVGAAATDELLHMELYPDGFRYKWYFEGSYIFDGENYWPAMSVARNLKPIQDAYNKLWSAFYTYAMNAAKPPMIGPKLDGEQYTSWNAGDYLQTDEPPAAWSPTITFQGGPIVQALSNLERIGDMIARISQNSMGTVQDHATTATTDSIVAAGVAVGIEEYIGNFVTPFPSMMEHTEDVLKGEWDQVKGYYTRTVDGQTVPLVDYEELKVPTTWRVNGTSPNATPIAKVRAAEEMAKMAQDPEFGFDKYELGSAIAKNSPLAGMGNVQLPKEELDKMLQDRMAAEQAAAHPEPKINEIVDAKMAAMMTPMEFGQFLKQIGIEPDPARGTMAPTAGGAVGGTGEPGAGGAGPHDAALVGLAGAPGLRAALEAAVAGGGGEVQQAGPGGPDGEALPPTGPGGLAS